MLAIAGGIILAVLFFALLSLMLTRGFLAAAAVLLVSAALFAFAAVAPTDVSVLAILVLLGIASLVQAAYVSRRDGVSLWRAFVGSIVPRERTPPEVWGIVPKNRRD